MIVSKVPDIQTQRALERMEAQQAQQDGLIEYVACIADVELPEADETQEVPDGTE